MAQQLEVLATRVGQLGLRTSGVEVSIGGCENPSRTDVVAPLLHVGGISVPTLTHETSHGALDKHPLLRFDLPTLTFVARDIAGSSTHLSHEIVDDSRGRHCLPGHRCCSHGLDLQAGCQRKDVLLYRDEEGQ